MEGRKAAMANRSLFLVVVLVIESRKIEEDEDEQERPLTPTLHHSIQTHPAFAPYPN